MLRSTSEGSSRPKYSYKFGNTPICRKYAESVPANFDEALPQYRLEKVKDFSLFHLLSPM